MSANHMTASERVLYEVLKKANLTQYYDAFISQGGDDVAQLCEAGEEEFLEIMALVGMASKPLHVRRLQKTLHQWLLNPSSFKDSQDGSAKSSTYQHPSSLAMSAASMSQYSALPASVQQASESLHPSPAQNYANNGSHRYHSASPTSEMSDHENSVNASLNNKGDGGLSSSAAFPSKLTDVQRRTIEVNADELAQRLPFYAPKPLNMKKPIDKEIDEIMNMSEDDPMRVELLRKYSAIYGRFDSKRRLEKQMNFHEMCVNEAAAQLCKHRPTLLTRREDLFVLSRQVVRDSGYQIAKPPVYKYAPQSMDLGVDASPQKLNKDSSYQWMNSVPTSMNYSHSSSNVFQQDQSRSDDSADVPSSLVDVGLCVARQYGLNDLEAQLREITKPNLQSKNETEEPLSLKREPQDERSPVVTARADS